MKLFIFRRALILASFTFFVTLIAEQGSSTESSREAAPSVKSQSPHPQPKNIQEQIKDLGNFFTEDLTGNNVFIPSRISSWSYRLTDNFRILKVLQGAAVDKNVAAEVKSELMVNLALFPEVAKEAAAAYRRMKTSGKWDMPGMAENDPYYWKNWRYADPRIEITRLHNEIYSCFYILANLGALDDSRQLLTWIGYEKLKGMDCRKMDAWLVHQYYLCSKAKAKTVPGDKEHAEIARSLEKLDTKTQSYKTSTQQPKLDVLRIPRGKEIDDSVAKQILESFRKAQPAI